MNRREKITFINEKILPTAEIEDWYWLAYGKEVVRNCIKAITKWRMGKDPNIEMNGAIIDGVLYLNGEPVKRVAPKLPRVKFSEEEYVLEGKILARSEL